MGLLDWLSEKEKKIVGEKKKKKKTVPDAKELFPGSIGAAITAIEKRKKQHQKVLEMMGD